MRGYKSCITEALDVTRGILIESSITQGSSNEESIYKIRVSNGVAKYTLVNCDVQGLLSLQAIENPYPSVPWMCRT